MKRIKNCLLPLITLLINVTVGLAQLSVAPIFSSDMVLQRGTTVPVFGTANAGASVSVQFLNQSKSTTADASGNWQISLSSMAANSSMNTMTVTSGGDAVSFTGVQVGEVWLCSGQSNMGWSLEKADDSAPAIADAGNHNIRLFRMTAGNGPETTTWKVSNSSTVANFSAVGYWKGLELSQWFGNVPIGLIQATHDGTAIDQWQHSSGGQGTDYDAMVRPIQPYAIKGVAWYQGESNGGDGDYDVKLTNMINEWRGDWGLPDLPFGINQLAGTSRSGGARLAQFKVSQTVPNTFLVVIADLPGGNQLHPTTKKPVGLRTAIGARGAVYGDNIPHSGPVIDTQSSSVSGNVVTLRWDFVGNGLTTNDGQAPSTFQVAGASGQFKSAEATIVGNTVEVSSPTVSDPVRVRYQFGSVGNLFNSVSIPIEGGANTLNMLPTSMFEYEVGVGPVNNPPVASFDYVSTLLSVDLDASASTDSDGSVSNWNWDYGDGNVGSGELVSHTYSASGSYSVSLTVTDDGGASDIAVQTITVSDGNSVPSAMFTYDANLLQADFDGSSSSDADGTIVSHSWDFGDGTGGSGQTVSHAYPSSGDYTVTLTVTDDGGAVASHSEVVSVSDGTGGSTMHVNDLVTYAMSAGGGDKHGVARVVMHDEQGSPVSGATVTGTFSGSFNEIVSGTTLSDGTIELVTVATTRGGVQVGFCVDNVSHSSLTYDDTVNEITCVGGGARQGNSELMVEATDFRVYPNPSEGGAFKVILSEDVNVGAFAVVSIYNIQGASAYHEERLLSSHILSFDLNLNQGLYFIEVKIGDLSRRSRLVVR